MSQYSDFSQLGYQVKEALGRNREAGRITHLAYAENPKHEVVIKEFRFADVGTDWSAFKAYERETEVLQQLNHPRIPRYLSSFETTQGFCLVQEYKNAPSLARKQKFTPEQVKQIAISILEILVYLQHQVPPIIHRDIKPENILVDEEFNAYLVDFGFARIRGGDVAVSSIAVGTPGFTPPEEYLGRNLTQASDLYSLGATLICLLTNTASVNVSQLIDDDHKFNFKAMAPQITPRFFEWLNKMVEPNVKNRFANASVALEALKPIPVSFAKTTNKHTNELTFRQSLVLLGVIFGGIVVASGMDEISRQQKFEQFKTYEQQEQIEEQQVQISQLLEHQERLERQLDKVLRLQQQQHNSFKLQEERDRKIQKERQQANLIERLQKTKECDGCNLQGIDLTGLSLQRVNLRNANLENANLENALLENANLEGANLKNAKFKGASLKNAKLANVKLRYATLIDTNLSGADLKRADLYYTKFVNTDLSGADLRFVDLNGVNLGHSKLSGAIMPDGITAKEKNRSDF